MIRTVNRLKKAWKLRRHQNSPSCDVRLTGSIYFFLRLRCEESVVYHEVVHLRNFVGQCVMFPQEAQQFVAGSIDGHLLRQQILILKHVFEENLSKSTSLTWLVNVKVQHWWSIYVTSLAVFVENVKRFAADLEKTNNEAAEKWQKKLMFGLKATPAGFNDALNDKIKLFHYCWCAARLQQQLASKWLSYMSKQLKHLYKHQLRWA